MNRSTSGFTIIEVLVACFVLIVGLAGRRRSHRQHAGQHHTRSEYMTQAATLATEKLEDLNRYPSTDPNVAVTSGTSAGKPYLKRFAKRYGKWRYRSSKLLRRSLLLAFARLARRDHLGI